MSEDIFEEEEQIAQEQASVEAHVLRQTMRDLPTLLRTGCLIAQS